MPDDSALRLVFLAPEQFYSREEPRLAFDAVLDYVRNNGTKPRYRGNRLIFLAPDHGALARLRDCIRVALAWGSIVEDVKDASGARQSPKEQAKKELQTAEEVLPRVARECYRWLLCPSQQPHRTQADGGSVPAEHQRGGLGEIERVCVDNELVITTWSPIHLRTKLKELYWKADKPAIGAGVLGRYHALPLPAATEKRGVLEQAIVKGAASRDFFGTAYGQSRVTFDGFKLGDSNVQMDDTLLLIEPETAKAYEKAHPPSSPGQVPPEPTM